MLQSSVIQATDRPQRDWSLCHGLPGVCQPLGRQYQPIKKAKDRLESYCGKPPQVLESTTLTRFSMLWEHSGMQAATIAVEHLPALFSPPALQAPPAPLEAAALLETRATPDPPAPQASRVSTSRRCSHFLVVQIYPVYIVDGCPLQCINHCAGLLCKSNTPWT